MRTKTIQGTNIAETIHGQQMAIYEVKKGWAIGPAFGRKRAKKQALTNSPAVWGYLPDHLNGKPFMGRI